MRFDTWLDSFYLVGSLWGTLTSPQICRSNFDTPRDLAQKVAGSPLPRARVTAFVNVNVIPMDTERVLPNQTVLIENGRITAVGPAAKVLVPVGAVQIEGRGKYLIPGLSNMHPHGRLSEARLRKQHGFVNDLATGVTTVRQIVGGELTPAQLRQYIDTAAVSIPRMYIAPKISGVDGSRPSSLSLDSVATVVAAAKAAGYHHIGIQFRNRDAGAFPFLDSLVAAARRAGLPVAEHDSWLPLERTLALGATGGSSEHLFTFLNALEYPTLSTKDNDQPTRSVPEVSMPKLQALAQQVQRAGLWVTPTLSCIEVKYSVHPTYTKVLQQIVKSLHDAGAGLLLADDDGTNVHDELAALVRAGLSPYQALVMGTRNPAQYLGLQDSSGTVAVGKWADLVLLEGNPLENIQHAQQIAGVMLGGRWLPPAELKRQTSAGETP